MTDLSAPIPEPMHVRAVEHLMASGPLYCWATDVTGRPVWASRAWTQFMGDDDRAEATSWVESHVHPDDRAHVIECVRSGIAERRTFRDTYRMRRSDGAWRWVLSHAEPYFDEHGEFAGFAGTSTDVTEAREAEAQRDNVRAFSRSLLDEVPGMVYLVDRAGIVRYLSRESRRLFDVAEGRLEIPLDELMAPGAAAAMHAENARILESGETVELERRLTTEHGERTLLVRKLRVSDPGTGEPLVLGLSTDVTELRAEQDRTRVLQAALHQQQRLESLGTLAGAIAHEFNNLLMSVVGNLDLVAPAVAGDADADAAVQRIGEATTRAAAITRQMLEVSGSARLSPVRLDVARLLDDLVPRLAARVPPPTTIHTEAPPGLFVNGDAASLRSAVSNLVDNAADSLAGRAGTIHVHAGSQTLDARTLRGFVMSDGCAPGPYVSLAVCDSGAGMDAETLARAFEPFFSTRELGRGLGLAAVRGIVRSHGGAIEVESAPGAGTTVRLWLPAAECESPRPEPSATAASVSGAVRVLVVDDEDAVCLLACTALTDEGFQTTPAADGDEALQIWDANRGAFDVVVADVTMPHTNGVALVRALRERGATVPVVLMSGFDAMNATRDADVVAVLEKPFRITQLLAVVRDAAARSSRAR